MTIRSLTARAAASLVLLLAGSTATASAATNTVTFGTEGEYPIVIPAGVTSLQVVAIGGKGGTGNYSVAGGFGARVSATLPVTGGERRYVVVAGNGLEGSPRAGAGSGGGASDIRTTPVAQGVTPTDTRLLIAGGGGGSGRGVNSDAAGSAGIGGDAGMPGGASRRDGGKSGGGGAGTAVAGGAGGSANPDRWSEAGWPGERGVGGNGGLAGSLGFPSRDQQASGGYNGGGWAGGGFVNYRPGGWETFYGGGGGGGGLHGGGGGGGVVLESTNDSGGGGGGGSSLVPAGGTLTTDTTGTPSITISFDDSVRPVVSLDPTPAATRGDLAVSGIAGTVLGDGAVTIDVYAGATASGAPVVSRTVAHDARSGAYETSLGALPEGQYSVRATQVDGAGNVGVSTTRTFVEDTTRPVISLTSPASGTLTNEAAPTFAGVAGTTPRDGATVQLVVFTAAAQVVAAPTGQRDGATGRYAITLPAALPDGVYFAGVRQTDSVGNEGESSVIVFVIDTQAPAPTLTAPAAGRSSDATPTFAGTGTTANGDVGSVEIRIHAGETPAGPVTSTLDATLAAGGGFEIDAAALPDGTYTAQGTQRDMAGNAGTTAPLTFTIDTAVPVTPPVDPGPGAPGPDVDPPRSPGADPPSGPGVAPPSGPGIDPPAPVVDSQAPVLSRISLSARRFRVGSARTRSAAKTLPRGTTLRYTLSEAATITVTLTRSGRSVAASTLTRRGAKGANRVAVSGRSGRNALPPGRYTLSLHAVDAAGNRGTPKKVGLRIVSRASS